MLTFGQAAFLAVGLSVLLALWILLGLAFAMLIGQVIKQRDTQKPRHPQNRP